MRSLCHQGPRQRRPKAGKKNSKVRDAWAGFRIHALLRSQHLSARGRARRDGSTSCGTTCARHLCHQCKFCTCSPPPKLMGVRPNRQQYCTTLLSSILRDEVSPVEHFAEVSLTRAGRASARPAPMPGVKKAPMLRKQLLQTPFGC